MNSTERWPAPADVLWRHSVRLAGARQTERRVHVTVHEALLPSLMSCCLSLTGARSCSNVSQVLPAGSLDARLSLSTRRMCLSSASCSRPQGSDECGVRGPVSLKRLSPPQRRQPERLPDALSNRARCISESSSRPPASSVVHAQVHLADSSIRYLAETRERPAAAQPRSRTSPATQAAVRRHLDLALHRIVAARCKHAHVVHVGTLSLPAAHRVVRQSGRCATDTSADPEA